MSAPQQSHTGSGGVYKRASRKGAPRRYACQFPSCDKVYSRQEHLQRHQLNHNPKEIFVCDVENCGQRFVRADLLTRHKKRHSGSYTPRNRIQSFTEPTNDTFSPVSAGILSPPHGLPASSASGHGDAAARANLDHVIGDAANAGQGAGQAGTGSSAAPGGRAGGHGGHNGHSGHGGHASSSGIASGSSGGSGGSSATSGNFNARLPPFPHPSPSVPHDADILLTPESSSAMTATSLPAATAHVAGHRSITQLSAQTPSQAASSAWTSTPSLADMANPDILRSGKAASYYQQPHQQYHPRSDPHTHVMQETTPTVLSFPNMPFSEPERENFAMWLFDTQPSYSDFSVAHLPFFEGGLESPFNNNIQYDYESLTSRSHMDTPPRQFENSEEAMTESRRQEIVRMFMLFRARQPQAEPRIPTLGREVNGDLPALSLEMLHDSLYEFWEHVSPRVPIIHQPTFSCNICQPLLLIVMVALGAASLNGRDGTGNRNLEEFGAFADIVVSSARFEILTAEEASPPVGLWVAQALLLLEFYEKMYSSRRLHERSHIYHTVTLTLLRRGSPLIGRSGSESPPDEMPPPSLSIATTSPATASHSPSSPLQTHPLSRPDRNNRSNHGHHHQQHSQHQHPQHQQQASESGPAVDWQTWWTRWAETEAMHRVVFFAFCLDIIHAAMFGHAADMAPHEIRLPLPCDDNLWAASKPEDVRQLDANLRMYGVKPISFLDGLKRAVHGTEVQTHSFGRMIIMCGLLSVGWHLSHRETHMKWLDLTTPSTKTQDTWRKTLLKAFDGWKESFDMVQGTSGSAHSLSAESTVVSSTSDTLVARRGGSNGPIQSAAVLYHLAHISLHVDIVDCQVYAGAKRLLGRKVSSQDYVNVVSRMKSWAKQASTRHAVFHAFKLLHRVLVDPRKGEKKRHLIPNSTYVDLPPIETQTYSIRTESDPHRPWIMYYAALSIWSFVRALGSDTPRPPAVQHGSYGRSQYTTHAQPTQSVQAHEMQHPAHSHSLQSPHQHPQHPHSQPPHAQHYGHQPSHLVSYAGHINLQPPQIMSPAANTYQRVVAYLSSVADLEELDERMASNLADGLPDLLDYLQNVFAEAHSELLREAHFRLETCRDLMTGGSG